MSNKKNKRTTIKGKINKSILQILIPALLLLILVSCYMAAGTVTTLNKNVLSAQSENAVNRVDSFFKNKVTAISMYQRNVTTQMYLSAATSTEKAAAYADAKEVVKVLQSTMDTMSSEGVSAAWVAGVDNGCYLMDNGDLDPQIGRAHV